MRRTKIGAALAMVVALAPGATHVARETGPRHRAVEARRSDNQMNATATPAVADAGVNVAPVFGGRVEAARYNGRFMPYFPGESQAKRRRIARGVRS